MFFSGNFEREDQTALALGELVFRRDESLDLGTGFLPGLDDGAPTLELFGELGI